MTDFDVLTHLETRYDLVHRCSFPDMVLENDYNYDKFNKEDTFKH